MYWWTWVSAHAVCQCMGDMLKHELLNIATVALGSYHVLCVRVFQNMLEHVATVRAREAVGRHEDPGLSRASAGAVCNIAVCNGAACSVAVFAGWFLCFSSYQTLKDVFSNFRNIGNWKVWNHELWEFRFGVHLPSSNAKSWEARSWPSVVHVPPRSQCPTSPSHPS